MGKEEHHFFGYMEVSDHEFQSWKCEVEYIYERQSGQVLAAGSIHTNSLHYRQPPLVLPRGSRQVLPARSQIFTEMTANLMAVSDATRFTGAALLS